MFKMSEIVGSACFNGSGYTCRRGDQALWLETTMELSATARKNSKPL